MSRRESVVYDASSRNRWDRARFDEYVRSRSRPGSREREIDIRISDNRRDSPGFRDRGVMLEERDRFVGGVELDRRREAYWEEPTPSEIANRALAPYRRKEYYEAPLRPARPRYIRRQSSLDTFDRIPRREYDDQWRQPTYVAVPVPYRRSGRGRYEDDFDDGRVRERDVSGGWEEEYRDVRVRRRGGRRRRTRSISVSSSSSSSSSDIKSLRSARSSRTVVKEEEKVELIGRRGRTRMPKRLVQKQIIIDMGLPFDEEEHFIIVRRALLKEHIDDIIKRSEGFRESNKVVYKFTEEIRPGGAEIRETEVKVSENEEAIVAPTLEIPPAPLSVVSGRGGTVVDERISRRESVIEDISPVRSNAGTIAIRARSQSQSYRRSDRSIREEIRALEAEREALRLERRADRRLLEGDRSDYDLEYVERRDIRPIFREELVTLGRDRRGKPALVSKKI